MNRERSPSNHLSRPRDCCVRPESGTQVGPRDPYGSPRTTFIARAAACATCSCWPGIVPSKPPNVTSMATPGRSGGWLVMCSKRLEFTCSLATRVALEADRADGEYRLRRGNRSLRRPAAEFASGVKFDVLIFAQPP